MTFTIELQDVLMSLYRWSIGLSIGATLALVWVLVAAKWRPLLRFSVLFFSFFRTLPIIALSALFGYISIKDDAKIALIAWACFFPVVISTASAIPKETGDLFRRLSLRTNGKSIIYKHFIIPQICRSFFAGTEIAIGIGWLTVVAAEIIGTPSTGWNAGGLGDKVYQAFQNGDFETGYIGLFIFGVLGVITTWIWKKAVVKIWALLYNTNYE